MSIAKPASHVPSKDQDRRPLAITVLHTGTLPTLAALRQAAELARDLGATIELLHISLVPYPLPIDHPPVDPSVLERRLRTLAGSQSIATHVKICYGRDVDSSPLASL